MFQWVWWSGSGASTCVFALSALIEGLGSHIQYLVVMWHREMFLMPVTQWLIHTYWSDHTNSKRMCVCFCVCVLETQSKPLPMYHTHTLVIQTIFLSVPISTIQTLPGMFSRGNVLQTQSMLLGMYVKLGKHSWTWHVNDAFTGTRLKSLLYYH